jgi:hypothetical protein
VDAVAARFQPSLIEIGVRDLAAQACSLSEDDGRFLQRSPKRFAVGETAGRKISDRVRDFGELAAELHPRFDEQDVELDVVALERAAYPRGSPTQDDDIVPFCLCHESAS